MVSKAADQIEKWVREANPESAHIFDRNRFYEIIFECLKNGEPLDSEDVRYFVEERFPWSDRKIMEFTERAERDSEMILGFIEFLKTEKSIDVNVKQ